MTLSPPTELVVVVDKVPLQRHKSRTTGLVRMVRIGPAAQGSKRALGPGRMVEQSWKVDPWRKFVAAKVIQARVGMNQWQWLPLEADFTFYLPRPKSHYRASGTLKENAPVYPLSMPDVDKLARAVMDAVTDSGMWDDDARVVDLHSRKRYAADDDSIGVVIRLTVKEDDDVDRQGSTVQ